MVLVVNILRTDVLARGDEEGRWRSRGPANLQYMRACTSVDVKLLGRAEPKSSLYLGKFDNFLHLYHSFF